MNNPLYLSIERPIYFIGLSLLGYISTSFLDSSIFYSSYYALLVAFKFINVSDSPINGALGILEGEKVLFLVGEAPI